MDNELGKKIVEIDARPSDSIVLALQQKRPDLMITPGRSPRSAPKTSTDVPSEQG